MFVALLRVFGLRIPGEHERSQVYAAWGGAVTTLVTLAVVLELDPLYFPAASAIAPMAEVFRKSLRSAIGSLPSQQ